VSGPSEHVRRRGPAVGRVLRPVAVTAVAASGLVGLLPGAVAARADRAAPLVVVQRRVVTVPGLVGAAPGPRSIVVSFARPTRRGDLLVAGVDDGVQTSGMTHARYLFNGWRKAASVIGGERAGTGAGSYATGGLQAAVYFRPDNPGGIVSVPVARIPPGSLDWVSVVLVEFRGSPRSLHVDATGTSTSGPMQQDWSNVSAVRTSAATSGAHDLVIAVFNNGGNAPGGVDFTDPPAWRVLGEVHDADGDQQPILVDYRVLRRKAVVAETDRYDGYPIDNCAVVAALR
jgi:hypothetical protein